jgi:hypothetical protein
MQDGWFSCPEALAEDDVAVTILLSNVVHQDKLL